MNFCCQIKKTSTFFYFLAFFPDSIILQKTLTHTLKRSIFWPVFDLCAFHWPDCALTAVGSHSHMLPGVKSWQFYAANRELSFNPSREIIDSKHTNQQVVLIKWLHSSFDHALHNNPKERFVILRLCQQDSIVCLCFLKLLYITGIA